MIEKELYSSWFSDSTPFWHDWIFVHVEDFETTMVQRVMVKEDEMDSGWSIAAVTRELKEKLCVETNEALADKIAEYYSCADAMTRFEALLKREGIRYDTWPYLLTNTHCFHLG